MSVESLSLPEIRFAYPSQPPCLDIPCLELQRGKVTVIAGENGSGKTTLMKILGGLLNPENTELNMLDGIRTDASYLHQNPYLFRGTVHRNLSLAAPDAEELQLDEALESVGLSGFAERKAKKLSGGESKRVALARCFLSDRNILLLDEPAAHVDAGSIGLIEEACRLMASRGRTVIVSSHRGGFGFRVADRIISLKDGRAVPDTTNILKGKSVMESDGHIHFCSGDVEFRAPLRDGDFRVAVLAGEDVLLSLKPLASSARNSLKGRISSLEKRTDNSVVASINCGIPLMSVITESAVSELGLEPGLPVYATFKASSVAMY